MLHGRYRVSEMGETITATYTYPLLLCAEALPLAAIQHPVQDGHWRTCDTVEIPSGIVSFVYDWAMATDVYRMVVNYEYKSPPTNMAVTTHDWEWISEDPITSSSYEAVEELYDDFFLAITNYLATNTYIRGYRWSQWKDGFTGTDPSFRFASRSQARGTSGSLLPPQVSCAVTEETDIRRRWGRFYLPFIAATVNDSGRFSTTMCDAVGAAAVTLLEGVESEWRHVTVSSLEPHVLPTRFVRVDDVPDVIRSRRWAAPTHRYRAAVS